MVFKVGASIILFLLTLEVASNLWLHWDDPFDNRSPDGGIVLKSWKNLPYRIPLKSGSIQKKAPDGKIIINHTYEIDEYKRRVTLPVVKKAENYLAYLGCSFAFGYGVKDDETLSSQTQKNLNNIRVYNYGVSGAGPIDALFRLKSIEPSELTEKKGVFIYFFFREQVNRLLNRPEYVVNSLGMNIVYEKDQNGDWKKAGFYRFIHPYRTWIYKTIIHSGFYQILAPFFSSSTFSEEDLKKLVEVLVDMKKEAKRLNGEFVFMIWPYIEMDQRLIQLLIENNVPYLDYSKFDIYKLTEMKVYIPMDGHPTPEALSVMGREIARDIKPMFSPP